MALSSNRWWNASSSSCCTCGATNTAGSRTAVAASSIAISIGALLIELIVLVASAGSAMSATGAGS